MSNWFARDSRDINAVFGVHIREAIEMFKLLFTPNKDGKMPEPVCPHCGGKLPVADASQVDWQKFTGSGQFTTPDELKNIVSIY